MRGDESPDDVAAETWLQVIRDLPRFRGSAGDFRAWLFTIARHRAIDQARARSARPVTLMAEVVDGPAAPSAERSAMEEISTDAALRLVATLPPEQAEMVMLRVVAGLDVAVVAQIIGKKPGTVRVGVHRALRTLSRNPRAEQIRTQSAWEVV